MAANKRSVTMRRDYVRTVPLAPRGRRSASADHKAPARSSSREDFRGEANRNGGTMAVAKKAAKKRAAKARTAPASHEFIRIVPLHTPKPKLELGERMLAEGEGDLFDGKPRQAPAGAKLTYRGGKLIKNVEVFVVYWGKKWATAASAVPLRAGLDKFFADIVTSALIDQLVEYSVTGQKIGHGKFLGSKVITTGAPAKSITDTQIAAQVTAWVHAGTVPKRTANTLYFVYLDPGIVAVLGGSRSCSNFCGYHNNTGATYYAVMPYPSCSGCLGGMGVLDALTGTSSHEMCEAITDPVAGSGWYDDANGEIGDICAWSFKNVAGHVVQLEWSNKHKKCV
jgi:hypothetical protein